WYKHIQKRNYKVIFIDNTYKTNPFKIPLIDIYGVSNIGSIFNVRFALINKEDIETCI
ncbi:hypothetical protein ACRALDRAFT_1026460, partial [Sodiomyces alcalophilus JCM 7366]|uniref:uncharacterized protein n=1 Tax=Sodiomyces alcalophilus JCM 7366 TaxID=591952 RepID=UPI0039B3DED2